MNKTKSTDKYNDSQIMFLPNEFDNCPIAVAVDKLKELSPQHYHNIVKRGVNENWTIKRLHSEIRAVADEVYWSTMDEVNR